MFINNFAPKVSVIIPTYNRAQFVCEAINSVLKQTYENYEIIIVDDGSTDNTGEVLRKYKNKIRYIYQENKGGAEARNVGIKHAKGELIAFLDSDDIWLPAKLEKQVEYLSQNPNISFVYSNAYLLNNGKTNPKTLFDMVSPISSKNKETILQHLFLHKPIYPSTVVMKRSCFEKTGLFNASLRNLGEDYDLWLRVAKYFDVGFINQSLVKIRDLGKKACSDMEPIYKTAIETRKKLIDSDPDFIDKNTANKFFSSAYYKLGCVQFKNGKISEVRRNFLSSIRSYFPGIKKYIFLFIIFLPSRITKIYKSKILKILYGDD